MAEIISEHEAMTEQKQVVGAQDQENENLAKLVNELLRRSQKASQELRGQWPGNYRFVVSGDQWPIRRPKWRFSEVVNVTWANIMAEVGLQTDSRPTFEYTATEPSDHEFAQVLQKINEVNWAKSEVTGHGWDRKIATAIFKSKLYHAVHAEVCWDEDMEMGAGDVNLKILDPYGCFWDPMACNIYEARYFIYAEITPTAKLRKEYPQFKDKFKADVSIFGAKDENSIDATNIDLFWNVGETGTRFSEGARTDRGENKYGGEPMTLKLRCWLKDETIEEILEEKDLGNGQIKKEYIQKKRFPKGRCIEVANNVVLKDEESHYDDGLFPIARLVNYDYGEYAGETEVYHQKGPQNILNYTWSYTLDVMKMGANPRNIIAAQDVSIAKKLTNEPGQNIVVTNPGNFRTEPGVGITPGLFNIVEKAEGLHDKVQGLTDVSRGTPDPAVTSGLMLDGFVEASQTRPRLKNRSVEQFLIQIGHLMASRYLQYYKVPRTFRITNQEGFPEFVEFHVEDKPDGGKEAVVFKTSYSNGIMTRGPEQRMTIKGIPDIKILGGSSLPFARSQRAAQASQLFTQGAITLESYLKALNWPNPEAELKKVQEQQLAQQGAPNAVQK